MYKYDTYVNDKTYMYTYVFVSGDFETGPESPPGAEDVTTAGRDLPQ